MSESALSRAVARFNRQFAGMNLLLPVTPEAVEAAALYAETCRRPELAAELRTALKETLGCDD